MIRLLPLFLALLVITALGAQTEPPLRIGTITVRPLDVYSHEEAGHGRLYQLADNLHIETRKSVIEKFLLFREGDVYSRERLAETERNLRAQQFLKSASVVASLPHDGVVDVVVTTQDSWSIAPETQAGSKGGKSTFGATLAETNLLGLGKDLELGWNKGVDRTRIGVNYNDPAFFAPYWKAVFGYAMNSDGYDHHFAVARPFYSFATPWATELSFTGFRQFDHLYGGGRETESFRQKHREIVASYGLALDPGDVRAHRITAGFRAVDDSFFFTRNTVRRVLPADREFRYLFVRYDSAANDFVKLNFVNKDIRYEDFNLGRQYSIEGAVSPRSLGAERTTSYVRVAVGDGKWLGDGFVLPAMSLSSRFDGGLQNTVATSSLLFVRRGGRASYPTAFLSRVSFGSGWRMDPEKQFFADGLTGLRGYRAHAFAGDRSLVINVEERLYLGREILQLASPGIVAFADAGNATSGGFTSLIHLKSDVGIGLRIGLPRTPKNLLRVDLAYALNRDPLGRKGWQLAFSSGQAF
ncbi:MAG: BamA/TamA family outer membrane protein [Acidobacteriota bacterium]|nr:BamA/TamA family outer membrane protein [Acidobacteriota bacterium]